ncbi:MAG: PAS domain S-box protein, partial [Deltaproteobacteria bacterium]|nr:PAS domain S-box protein [Deltaproteobacteria bacterium]
MLERSIVGELEMADEGAILAISQAGARLLGYGSVESCLASKEKVWATSAAVSTALSSEEGTPVTFIGALRRREGQALTCRFIARKQPGGHWTSVEFVPLPDHRVAEERCGDFFLASLIDELPNPVFVKDEQHRWLALNDGLCLLLGHPREELLGRSEYDFFPASEADLSWARDEEVLRTGMTNESEERFTDGKGQVHVVLSRKSLSHDGCGRPILLGVITDITERKQMERELRRSRDELDARVAQQTAQLRHSEERFRLLAEWMPQIVWTAAANGALDYINQRGPEFVGVPVEEGLGSGWLDFVHPDDRSRVLLHWKSSVESGETFESEYRLRRSDQSYHWHLVRALPLPGPDGTIARWVGTATDIEEQKQVQRLMEDEDRRKNDFLALLAHELRNPLTPVRNAAYLLKRVGPESPAFGRAVDMVERQITQMTRLIDDLLDVSRIARNKILLQKERLDLGALVRTTLDDRRESLASHGLALGWSLPAEPVWVEADAVRIAQALGNLL